MHSYGMLWPYGILGYYTLHELRSLAPLPHSSQHCHRVKGGGAATCHKTITCHLYMDRPWLAVLSFLFQVSGFIWTSTRHLPALHKHLQPLRKPGVVRVQHHLETYILPWCRCKTKMLHHSIQCGRMLQTNLDPWTWRDHFQCRMQCLSFRLLTALRAASNSSLGTENKCFQCFLDGTLNCTFVTCSVWKHLPDLTSCWFCPASLAKQSCLGSQSPASLGRST